MVNILNIESIIGQACEMRSINESNDNEILILLMARSIIDNEMTVINDNQWSGKYY